MKYLSGREELDQIDKNSNLKALLSHNLDIIFDNTFKIQDFVYKSKGKLDYVNLFIHDDKKINFFDFNIQNIIMKDTNLDFRFGFDKKNYINLSGIYNVNDLDFKKFSFKNNFFNKSSNAIFEFEYLPKIYLGIIDYEKENGKLAKILLKFKKNNDLYNFEKINFSEDNNKISIDNLKINKKRFISLDKISVKTFEKNDLKNDFNLQFGKKIIIIGKI